MFKLRYLLLIICVYSFEISNAQLSIRFENIKAYPNAGSANTFNGDIILCNNTGRVFPGNSEIKLDMVWPSLVAKDLAWNIKVTSNGASNCDTKTISFATDWDGLAPGECIRATGIAGEYVGPLVMPPYGLTQAGDTVWHEFGPNSYYPEAYQATSSEFKFDPECFIPSPDVICLGEAQIAEWSGGSNLDLADVRVPANRKGWAIAAAHVQRLFTNLAGAEITDINYVFAQSMIEGRMGCDAGIVPPPDDNPLDYRAGSVAGGCFQILPPGFAQLKQFYPALYGPLSYGNIISGDNFITAALSKALYDMTTFDYYEKVFCTDPIGFFTQSADKYIAEEVLAYSYHEGLGGSFGGLSDLFVTNRATLINNPNIANYFANSRADAGIPYMERMRNNMIQMGNDFGVAGGNSTVTSDAKNNWQPFAANIPPYYEYHGCYNEPFTWADFEAYIDEAARLFWTANVPDVKAKTKAAFDAINGGAAVNFTLLGPAIDAMTMAFPAYSTDEGLGNTYQATMCGSPAISLSTCDAICPGEDAEVWVNFMGTPSFTAAIQGPDGEIYNIGPTIKSPSILKVNKPGQYKVISFTDANGTVFTNCHNASALVENAGDATAEWNRDNFDAVKKCSTGDLILDLTGAGPWDITYTKNGGPDVVINIPAGATPHVIETPAQGDEYILKRMVAGGCDSELKDTIVFCSDCTLPKLELGADITVCANQYPFDITGPTGMDSYTWNGVVGASNVFTVLDSGKVVLTIDSMGCIASDSIRVNTKPTPVVDLGTDITVCGTEYPFDVTGPTGMDSYTWNGVVGASNVFSVLDSGKVLLTIDSMGCIASDSIRVNTNPTPKVELGTDISVCAIEYPFDITGPTGMDSYTWNGVVGASNVFTVLDSGKVVLTVDSLGCTSSDSVRVITNPSPVVDLGNDTTICATGYPFDITGPAGMDSYVWTGSTGGASAGNDNVFTVPDSGKVVLTVDSMGCVASDSMYVFTSPLPKVNLGNDVSLCLSAYPYNVTGPTGMDSYTWNGVLGASNIYAAADSGSVILTVDSAGCSSSDTLKISSIPTPVFDLGNDVTVCSTGYPFDITGPTGMDSYTWNGVVGASNVFTVLDSGKVVLEVDSAGCSYQDSLLVGTYPSPVVALGNDITVCQTDIDLDAGAGFNSYMWNNDVTLNNQNLQVSTSGTYMVEVVDANGCIGKDTIEVTMNPYPVVNIGGLTDTATICPTSPAYQFNATTAGATYSWQDASTDPTYNTLIQGDYWVDVTVNGCTTRDSAYLKVSNQLDVQIIGGDQTICPGTTASFYTNFNGSTHDWNTGAGALDTFKLSVAGTIDVTVTDAGGCSGTASAELFVTNPLTIELGANPEICAGDSVTIGVTNRNGLNYNWNTGATDSILTIKTGGLYTLTVDSMGCTFQDDITVIENALPQVSLGNDTFVCVGAGQSILLDAGAGFTTYTWSGDTTSANQTVAVGKAGKYVVTVIDANGCSNKDSINITERTATVVDLSIDETTICPGGDYTYTVPVGLQGVVGTTWEWQDGSTGVNYVVQNQLDGATVGVKLTYTNQFGCVSDDSSTVKVRNVLPINITSDTICEGDNVVFSTGYVGAEFTHAWNNNPINNQPTFSINNATVADAGIITVTVASNLGCSGDTTVNLVVNTLPTPVLTSSTGKDSLCVGESLTLSTGVAGSHLWNDGSQATTLAITNAQVAGVTNYSVTVINANNCVAQANINISVFNNPIVNIIEPSAACIGQAVELSSNLSGNNTYTLTWSGTGIGNTVGSTLNVTTDGTYSVLAENNNTGCSTSTAIEVEFLVTPTVNLPTDSVICEDTEWYVAAINNADLGGYDKLWSTGSTGNGIIVGESGAYWLEVTNGVCVGKDTVNVIVSPYPVSQLPEDITLCFEDVDSLNLSPGRHSSYLWNDGSTEQSKVVTDRGYFSVIITNYFGCETFDEIEIKEDCPASVWIPNSFTPNYDGLNDFLVIKGRGIEEVEMQVFNRWGEQIWVGRNIGDAWDGTYNDLPVQQDVYVYRLNYSYTDVNGVKQNRDKVGIVTIIR